MRTFTQKQNQPQDQLSSHLARSNAPTSGPIHHTRPILHSQRTAGNQAVQPLMRTDADELDAGPTGPASTNRFAHDFSRIPVHSKSSVMLQPKLALSTPGDIYEQEADSVAHRVVRMAEPPRQGTGVCPGCRNGHDAHEHLQTKRVQANYSREIAVPPIVHEVLHYPGQPLDVPTRGFMESRFGQDFSHVRLHLDSHAAESAHAMNARAYTVGRDIVFGAGQYSATTSEGRELLAHELTHTIQQSTGHASSIEKTGEAMSVAATEHDEGRAVFSRVGRRLPATARPLVNEAAAGVLQRQSLEDKPTGGSNPNAIIPIAKFIEYVQAVERANPKDSPAEILTRIRQQYYSGIKFDQLIPRAHSHDLVSAAYGPYTMTVAVPRTLSSGIGKEAYEHLTAKADENALQDNPSPYIQLPGGERVDIGHLLLGLDALLHPETSVPFSSYDVPNIDPSSYVADLGIASVWMTHHEETGKPHSDSPRKLNQPNLDEYYNMSAPTEDLLGDVDSFGAHQQWMATSGQTLSQVLLAYYLGGTKQTAGVQKRWQTFCAKNGFKYKQSGTSITWDVSVYFDMIQRVRKFSDLYSAGTWGALKGSIGTPENRHWPHTVEVVSKFLKWLKTNLEKELASGK